MTPTPVKLGTIKAKSAPNVFGDSVWFRGEDDLIWHMRLDKPEAAVNPQGLKALSTPQPSDDGFVYFQGENNTLVMMEQRFPHLHTVVDGIDCWAIPAAPNDGFVYCRTGAGKLARVSIESASFGTVTLYDVTTAFAPAVHITGEYAYAFFANGSYKLQRLDLDRRGARPTDHGDFTLKDAPVMGANGRLYIVDTKHDAYEIDPVSAAAIKIAANVQSTPVTSEIVDDHNMYWRAVGDALYMAPRSDTSKTTKLGETDARPDAQGDGFVYFLGDDEYIYRVATTAA